ncbi:MAG TPA: hypothetical protein VG408_08880 [Actinomycetota bacterium]|nr:hypothetical protein [Actinomycetota bacterium]
MIPLLRRPACVAVAGLLLVTGSSPSATASLGPNNYLETSAGQGAREPDKSSNLYLVRRFRYPGGGGDGYVGTDTDFSGRFAYGGHYGPRGGIHIFDITGDEPTRVSFFGCPGNQNDVAVVSPGIVALGFHSSRCAKVESGIQLIDVRDPKRPKLLGAVEIPDGGTHTLTVYPGKPIIYSSNSGSGSDESIVDASDPNNPRIVNVFDSGPNVGCHDVSFWFKEDEKLAFCAGSGGGSQIWDVSDPFEPTIISEIINPAIFFHHSIAATPDGKFLAIGDESFATCTGTSAPAGAIWFYDIRDRSAPKLVGYFGLGRDAALFCTAHNFEFIPGTRFLVASWYGGGMNVIDASDPANPKEVAHFQDAGTDYWSAFWHEGRIYASGIPGLDVFEIEGLREGP